jgi:TorA maturation chaperone TorD
MELIRALGALAELPGREQLRLAELLTLDGEPTRAEYTHLFVLELPPYASPYLGEQGMLGGAVRERVTGFWGALAELPPPEADHLAALLGLYAAIEAREETQDDEGAFVLRHARKALFWEHIASWVPAYLSRAVELAAPVYRSWASLLMATLEAQAHALEAPNVAPLHFREAGSPLPLVFDGVDDLAAALLTPARSGVILARADLARMARTLGAGARVGSRRGVMSGLIRDGGERALAWLAQEASRQASAYAAWAGELAPVRDFWQGRAARTVGALEHLKAELTLP